MSKPFRQGDHGRAAVVWLATGFVYTAGLLAVTFMIAAFSDHPERDIAYFAGAAVVMAILTWLFRDKTDRPIGSRVAFWLRWSRKESEPFRYEARRRKSAQPVEYGTNTPPTAETVRAITEDDARTWIPRSGPPKTP